MSTAVWSTICGVAVIVGYFVPWWPLRATAICVVPALLIFGFGYFVMKIKNVYALRYFCVILASFSVIAGHILNIYTVYESRVGLRLEVEVGAAAVLSLVYLFLISLTMELIGGDRRY